MKRRDFIHQTTGLGVVVAAGTLPGSFLSVIPPVSIDASSSKLTPPAKGKIPVAFAISEGATVIDFAGPWEVFQDVHVTTRGTSHDDQMPFQLFTVAEKIETITGSGGLKLVPDYTFDTAPTPKVVVVPAQRGSKALHAWLRKVVTSTDVLMSVCTGAFQLGHAGLLKGKSATTHHDFFDEFARAFPDVTLKAGSASLKKRRSQPRAVYLRESTWRCGWSIDTSDATSRSRLRFTWSIKARVGSFNHKKAQKTQNAQKIKWAATIIAVWAVLGLIYAGPIYFEMRAEGMDHAAWRVFSWGTLMWLAWAPLTPVIAWFARRYSLLDGAWKRNLLVHVPAFLAMSVLHTAASTVIFLGIDPFDGLGDGPKTFWPSFLLRVPGSFRSDLLIYGGVIGICYAFDYYRKYRESLADSSAEKNYLTRLMIKASGRVVLLKVGEIDFIEADGNYAKLHVGRKAHLLREKMHDLEGRLDPAKFVRIHRSIIVNLDRIKELHPHFNGDYIVVLEDGRQLRLSRTRRENLEARLNAVT